ncbi:hypothetical protein [Anaeromicrobium sediminis]|uniref:Uncharacterized protein n=1 Tax=Anaeromicrobium sediminis TaxID=1478221 RepID=A0A267MIL8_9FIRM|nr:hypothetical protein [Anaeromicrobium sediminis]PAB58715.1 hypothetical protein CCE28_13675 [Anaeromicrobium sediminis]
MKRNKENELRKWLFPVIAMIAYQYSNYIPDETMSYILIIIACALMYYLVKGRIKKESYLWTGLYACLTVTTVIVVIIRSYKGSIHENPIYNKYLWPGLVIFGTLGLIFGIWGNFKYSDDSRRREMIMVLIMVIILVCIGVVGFTLLDKFA